MLTEKQKKDIIEAAKTRISFADYERFSAILYENSWLLEEDFLFNKILDVIRAYPGNNIEKFINIPLVKDKIQKLLEENVAFHDKISAAIRGNLYSTKLQKIFKEIGININLEVPVVMPTTQSVVAPTASLQSFVVPKKPIQSSISHKTTDETKEQQIYEEVYRKYNNMQLAKVIRFSWGNFTPSVFKKHFEKNGFAYRLEALRSEPRDKPLKARLGNIVPSVGFPQFPKKQTEYMSKKTSTSAISALPGAPISNLSRLFGLPKSPTEQDESVGVVFFSDNPMNDPHFKISLISHSARGLTRFRKYGFLNAEQGAEYDKEFGNLPSVQALFQRSQNNPYPTTNELLTRLEFDANDPRCQVLIGIDNIRSKMIAQLRLMDIKNIANVDFVPASFYLPQSSQKIRPYYLVEQKKDLEQMLNPGNSNINKKTRAIAVMVSWFNNNINSGQLTALVKKFDIKKEFLQLLANGDVSNITAMRFFEKFLGLDFSSLTAEEKLNLVEEIKEQLVKDVNTQLELQPYIENIVKLSLGKLNIGTPIHKTTTEIMQDLSKNFSEHVKFIADRTYLQKMGQTQFKDLLNVPDNQLKKSVGTNQPIRGLHGVLHAIRVTSYIDILHGFRKGCLNRDGTKDLFPDQAVNYLSEKFGISPQDILTLTKLAAFFHDSAREKDGKDEWDEQSAENCRIFLVQQGLKDSIARFFANAARYKDNPKEFKEFCESIFNNANNNELQYCDYIRHLINASDTLDIMRVRPTFDEKYLNNFCKVDEHQTNRDNANRLMQDVRSLINSQRDLKRHSCRIKLQDGSFLPDIAFNIPNDNTNVEFDNSQNPYQLMQEQIKQQSTYLLQLRQISSSIPNVPAKYTKESQDNLDVSRESTVQQIKKYLDKSDNVEQDGIMGGDGIVSTPDLLQLMDYATQKDIRLKTQQEIRQKEGKDASLKAAHTAAHNKLEDDLQKSRSQIEQQQEQERTLMIQDLEHGREKIRKQQDASLKAEQTAARNKLIAEAQEGRAGIEKEQTEQYKATRTHFENRLQSIIVKQEEERKLKQKRPMEIMQKHANPHIAQTSSNFGQQFIDAVNSQQFKQAEQLLNNHSIDIISYADADGNTPIHHMVKNKLANDDNRETNKKLLQQVLDCGANVNAQHPTSKVTALHRAITVKEFELATLLLENSADLYTKTAQGKTSLDLFNEIPDTYKQYKGYKELERKIKQLTNPKPDVIKRSPMLENPLLHIDPAAEFSKSTSHLPEVSSRYSEPNSTDSSIGVTNSSPNLSSPTSNNSSDLRDPWLEAELLTYIREGQLPQLTDFLAANPVFRDYKDADGNSLLHLAVSTPNCRPGMLNALRGSGLNVNAKNNKGKTPLYIAVLEAKKPSFEVVKTLIEEFGADVTLNYGVSAPHTTNIVMRKIASIGSAPKTIDKLIPKPAKGPLLLIQGILTTAMATAKAAQKKAKK